MFICFLLLPVLAAGEESLFAPTPMPVVDRMLQFAEVTKDDVLWDLGCGDGRIPILAAKKYQCRSYGVEIDREVANHAARMVVRNGVKGRATIYYGDCLQADFSAATVVTLYLMPSLSRQLIPALEKLKSGSRIVAHDKPIPDWRLPNKAATVRLRRPDGTYEDHVIYLWRVP
jgi:hypothetical protein